MYKPLSGLFTNKDAKYNLIRSVNITNTSILFTNSYSVNDGYVTVSPTNYFEFHVDTKFNLYSYARQTYNGSINAFYINLLNLDTNESYNISVSTPTPTWTVNKNLPKGNYRIYYKYSGGSYISLYKLYIEDLVASIPLVFKNNEYYNINEANYDYSYHNYNKLASPADNNIYNFFNSNYISYPNLFTNVSIDGSFKPISKFSNFKIRKLKKELTAV